MHAVIMPIDHGMHEVYGSMGSVSLGLAPPRLPLSLPVLNVIVDPLTHY